MTSILFVATSSNANPGGGRTRIVDAAREAHDRGFSPYVLCFFYGAQARKGWRALSIARTRLQEDASCPVFYAPSIPFAWLNWLNNWYSGLLIFLICRWRNIHIVYGHGTKAGYLALYARKLDKHLKIISDIQGAISDELMYAQRLSPADKAIQRIQMEEMQTLIQSDNLIFVSHAMKTHYENKLYGKLAPSIIVPCATRTDFMLDKIKREKVRLKYGVADRLVVCYSGSIRAYQLPKEMVTLFLAIHHEFPQAFFLIFSKEKEFFENLFENSGISSNDYFIDFAPQGQLFERLQAADVGLLLRDDSIVNRVSSPTKFAEYLLCGLPVITTPFVGDYGAWIQEYKLGHLVNLNHLTEIDDSLYSFLQKVQENRGEFTIHCSQFAQESLTWKEYQNVLVRLLSHTIH